MKPILATLLLALLPITACVAPDHELDSIDARDIRECEPGTTSRPDLEQLELGPDGAVVLAESSGPLDGPGDQVLAEAPSDACRCASDGCIIGWIEDNLGCGVCATVECDDGRVGGCVPCGTSTDEALPEAPADEPCLLPPSDDVAR